MAAPNIQHKLMCKNLMFQTIRASLSWNRSGVDLFASTLGGQTCGIGETLQ